MFIEGRTKVSIRAQSTIDELEAVQVLRVLTDEESLLLERSLAKIGPKRDVWRWHEWEDRKLIMLIKRRGWSLRIKPFQRNDEVAKLAEEMGRSYLAVHKRIQRLRKKMKCPNANSERER